MVLRVDCNGSAAGNRIDRVKGLGQPDVGILGGMQLPSGFRVPCTRFFA
ncbi:hypothetical protein ACFL43_02840 [Thermodesulfobacteriota bacterium]